MGKDILIHDAGLGDTTLTAEAKYLNFTLSGKRFVLSLHYNGSFFRVPFLIMLQKYINSKQKTMKQKIIHCV